MGHSDIKSNHGHQTGGKVCFAAGIYHLSAVVREKSNIVMINLQELEFDHLLEYHALHKYILEVNIRRNE